ncbi:MAG TPA: hypothetical protein VFU04_03760, partial [Solirubrobacterales bacterium]|nr:hypothetical protein [Solirubrobacterales bacterium]
LVHDHRLDGRIVTLAGTVHGSPTSYPGYTRRRPGRPPLRLVKQRFLLRSASGEEQAWCVATRRAGHRLHAGDRVLIRALGIAWGPASSDGRSIPTVSLACVAVRRLPASEDEEEVAAVSLLRRTCPPSAPLVAGGGPTPAGDQLAEPLPTGSRSRISTASRRSSASSRAKSSSESLPAA